MAFGKGMRRCLACNYSGEMKTWLANYSMPQFILIVLSLMYILPGIIFLAWGWGKYKCPVCGALNKSVPLEFKQQKEDNKKKCPYCAELIQTDAVLCRFCGKSV